MGIKGLSKFIKTYAPSGIEEITTTDLYGMTICFDTSILLYQYVIALKGHGNAIINNAGIDVTHIHATLMKTFSILKKKMNPIFIIDGKPPEIKIDTLKNRLKIRQDATNKLNNTINLSDDHKNKLIKQSIVITKDQMEECVQIFKLLGMPVIQAKQEADAQCAYLSKTGIVDAVASEDMDLLTFGTKILLRDINKKVIYKYILSKILDELKLTHLQFIDLCILLGCDYCPTIEKLGPKHAYELLKIHGSIENIILMNDNKYEISDEFMERFQNAREYFLQPPVYTKNEFSEVRWNTPFHSQLKHLMINKYSYEEVELETQLAKMKGGHFKNIVNKSCLQIMLDKNFSKYEKDSSDEYAE